MTVVVTGGAGYIGSHVCQSLAQKGYKPIAYDALLSGYRSFVRFGPFVEGDIRDTQLLTKTLKYYQPIGVIHLASYINVGESMQHPLKYYVNNVGGSLSLIEAMKEAGSHTLVFSSTAAVYGTPTHVPIPEETPFQPINPYGKSKAMIEMVLADAIDEGLASVSLRYFNACGASIDASIGEKHNPETHLIPLAFQAQQSGRPLSVFGKDYPTFDGTAIRDYIHVLDLAEAHIKALQLLQKKGGVHAFNLGTGRGYSVLEVLQQIEKTTGAPVPFAFHPRRKGDPPILVANSTSAQTTLAWKPAHSSLETIIETAHRWHTRERMSASFFSL